MRSVGIMSYRSLLICCLLCLLAFVARAAEIAPQRLMLLRGVVALVEDRTADAVTDLQDAAGVHPEDWQVQMLYGQALLKAGQFAFAKAQLRRAVLLAPSRPEPWQALAQAGRTLRDPHLEFAALAGVMRLWPEDPQLQRRMAELYRQTGQPLLANKLDAAWSASLPPLKLDYQYTSGVKPATVEELRRLAHDEPTNNAILGALATEEWRVQHRDACREALKLMYAQSPSNLTVVSNYVHVCLVTGQVTDAVQTLQAAIPIGYEPFDRLLAVWSLSQGQYKLAMETLQRLLTRNPIDAVLNRQFGVACLFNGDADTAESALRLAWLKEHSHLVAQTFAAALVANGHTGEAEGILKNAISQYPDESLLKVALSLIFRDTNRLIQCADLTAVLAKERPETVELTQLAGERYWRAGNTTRVYTMAIKLRDDFTADVVAVRGAVQLFRRLSALPDARLVLTRYLGPSVKSPLTAPEVLVEVARFAAEDNRLPEAKLALEQALKQDATYRPAFSELGKLAMQEGQWAEAARIYVDALRCWPRNLELTLALARASRQAGNYPQAITVYQQATTLTTSATPWLELGEVFHSQDDENRARECWLTAENHLDGVIPARVMLLTSYEHAGDTAKAVEVIDELIKALATERETRSKRWRGLFAAQGFTVTDEEINALLLLAPELTDPAPLPARRQALLDALHPPTPEPQPLLPIDIKNPQPGKDATPTPETPVTTTPETKPPAEAPAPAAPAPEPATPQPSAQPITPPATPAPIEQAPANPPAEGTGK